MRRGRRLHRKDAKKQKKIIVFSLLAALLCLSIGYAAFSTNIDMSAKGNLKDKSRIIKSWNDTSNEDFHTDFYRENIISVTFLDSAIVPSNATESWDVSETKDNGVMAYVVESNTETGKYDLYIGAKNGVIAGVSTANLFRNFTSVKMIKFNHNFDTSKTISMYYMFFNCINLEELDLSNFDTGNVTNMGGMFEQNNSLKKLDVSSFNTSKVKLMWWMFHGCKNLETLQLNNFDTSNVTNMASMFGKCTNLKKLDLCSFNTKNVTTMSYMFSYLTNINSITVGSDWSVVSADTSSMFTGSNISYVTTGKCGS